MVSRKTNIQIAKKRVMVSCKTKSDKGKDKKSAQIEKTTPETAPEAKFEDIYDIYIYHTNYITELATIHLLKHL